MAFDETYPRTRPWTKIWENLSFFYFYKFIQFGQVVLFSTNFSFKDFYKKKSIYMTYKSGKIVEKILRNNVSFVKWPLVVRGKRNV